jgi:hypothetical protein
MSVIDDFDLAEYADRFAAAVEAGEVTEPGARQECVFSLAQTDDPAVVDPGSFAQGGPLDSLAPGAVLAAMAETACEQLAGLSDNALLGLVGRSRALAGRAAAIQQKAIAEYARRQRESDPNRAGKAGYTLFAQDDLAPELVVNSNQAEDRMTRCEDAERRLPKCSRALWDGLIIDYQMKIITDATMCLADESAAEADEILASAAPELTPGQLRAMAARLILMIDPEAAKDRRKEAAKKARVEKFQEMSGTAALCGRDLPTQAVLRSWQHIDSRARALKAAGAGGTLQQLRVAVYLALTSGNDPLALLPEITEDPGEWAVPKPGAADDGSDWPWSEPDEAENRTDDDQDGGDGGIGREPEGPKGPRGSGGGSGKLGGQDAPFEAVINLLVPVGTAFGWSSAPGEIPGYGPVDPETLTDLLQSASAHPKTRWCVTVIDPVTKEAVAHGCAPGQHRWNPNMYRTGGGDRDGPEAAPDGTTGPGTEQDQRAAEEFLASLRVKLAPIARKTCDHTHYTDKYEVPRKLKHLVKARRATCIAPCCNRSAADGDADHTIPWPEGPTCEENLGAPCRYHHRNKQEKGWNLSQPEPGVFNWTGPAGRTRTTRPGKYLI